MGAMSITSGSIQRQASFPLFAEDMHEPITPKRILPQRGINNGSVIRNSDGLAETNKRLWAALGDPSRFLRTENLEFRGYQFNIVKAIYSKENTLVILPTALGKTPIALFSMAGAISSNERAIFLAATKPLAEQHYNSVIERMQNIGRVALLNGETAREKRAPIENAANIIIATPETILNDLRSSRMSLEGIGLVVFDECHRMRGNAAYVPLAELFAAKKIQMIGTTASPSSKKEKMTFMIDALKVTRIEARNSKDRDISKYTMPKQINIVKVDKSEKLIEIGDQLRSIINENFQNLKDVGFTKDENFQNVPIKTFMEMGKLVSAAMKDVQNYSIGKAEKDRKMAAVRSYYKLSYISHPYDVLERQGFGPFIESVMSMEMSHKKSKSVAALVADRRLISAVKLATDAVASGEEHPKVLELIKILKETNDKVTVFAQYKSTVKMLVNKLDEHGIKVSPPFMGQKNGITQKQQSQIIRDFRESAFRVLVSTCLGEEGLDIPQVPLVVCYEPTPSAIRSKQRKGRAGRDGPGRVITLVTKDTNDEVYQKVAAYRERNMDGLIDMLRTDPHVFTYKNERPLTAEEMLRLKIAMRPIRIARRSENQFMLFGGRAQAT